jgi:D-aminopeptidase
MLKLGLTVLSFLIIQAGYAQNRIRDEGIEIGVLPTGEWNAITDVEGVMVGHKTLIRGNNVRTGVTAILPHDGNLFQEKVPAAIYVGNGFGKLTGVTQVRELGNIETPIILTNTLSVPVAAHAVIGYMLNMPGNAGMRSVNPIVGETNDGYLNDIRGDHIKEEDVLEAIAAASKGPVEEGNTGAGTGTVCFGYKGGIGTSSRQLPESLGGYTVGVLVQTNFGGVLEIGGVPIGKLMNNFPYNSALENADGSCMIIVATDAPLSARNLERLAKRAVFGLAKTGGIASNGSGDYVIAFSTYQDNRIKHHAGRSAVPRVTLPNGAMTPLFLGVIEATEEAILNSLFAAESMSGTEGHSVNELPVDEVLKIMKEYQAVGDN